MSLTRLSVEVLIIASKMKVTMLLLAVTVLNLMVRVAPQSGTSGDDSRLLIGLRQQTGAFFASCEAASLPDAVGIASLQNLRAITSDSEDGGPLMDNAVFISDQRVLALKRTAVLRIEMLNQVQNDVM